MNKALTEQKQLDAYGEVDASPTKNFFVSMLTRDVSLLDAILDLLDNCVDGVLRNKLSARTAKPYAKFFATIEFDSKKFYIHDNCGGIPWSLSDYAFRMGKPPTTPSVKLPTVGVYGIGMKRAIFKMGESCLIQTQAGDDRYELEIDKSWLRNEEHDGWNLQAKASVSKMSEDGTTILVSDLHPSIKETFEKQGADFKGKLIEAIETHYAQIIGKGFTIKVNDTEVKPKEVKLAFAEQNGKPVVRPYFYEAEHDGVKVFLAVGFTRPIPDLNEQNEEASDSRYSKEQSGWTIICNDRVVLYADKSERTGWGISRVPRYHPQFIAITGVVQFTANDASKLPTLTTKRGLDMGSVLYLQVRERMVEGMKLFTDFTNRWKSEIAAAKDVIRSTPLRTIAEIQTQIPKIKSQLKTAKRGLGGQYYLPTLPAPKVADTKLRKILFSRDLNQVEELSLFFFGVKGHEPSEVGEAAFDGALQTSRKS